MGAQAIRLSNVDIDKALDDGDFEILFQPIYNLSDGTLVRHETFVRWRHATLGLLPPGAFISFFETQGRMSELTRYVLNRAVEQYLSWRGPYGPGFSINLALSDVVDDSFAAHFEVAMRDRAFPTEHLTFECPMPPVNTNISTAISNYQRLAATGARLSIEVRGRANDFLKTIDPFPFSEIKTGGAAILRFARTVRGPGIASISELLELAADKGATITAVGVEDQASLVALRGIGFAAAQGNHLGRVGELSAFKPSKINEVRALLGLEAFSTDDLSALFRDSPSDGPTEASPSKADSDPVQPAGKSAAKPRATRKKAKPSLDPIANNTVGTGSSSKSKLLSATAPATEKSVDAEELREAVLAKISQRKLTKPTLAESGRTTDKGTDKSGLEGRDQELVDKLSKRIARELNGTKDEMDLEAATNRKAVSLARSANRKPRKSTSRKGDQRAAVKEALAPKAASEEDLLPNAENSLSMDSDDSATTEAKAPVDKSHNEQEPLRQDGALVEPATSALLDGEEASNDLPLSDSGSVVPSKDDKPAKSKRKRAPSSRAKAKAKKATDNVSDASSAVNTTTEEAEAQHSSGEADEEAAVAHKAPRKSRRKSDKDPFEDVEDLTGDLFETLTDDSNDQSDAAAVFAADGSASTDDQKVDDTPTIPAILKSDIDKTVGGTDLPSAETADVTAATEEISGHDDTDIELNVFDKESALKVGSVPAHFRPGVRIMTAVESPMDHAEAVHSADLHSTDLSGFEPPNTEQFLESADQLSGATSAIDAEADVENPDHAEDGSYWPWSDDNGLPKEPLPEQVSATSNPPLNGVNDTITSGTSSLRDAPEDIESGSNPVSAALLNGANGSTEAPSPSEGTIGALNGELTDTKHDDTVAQLSEAEDVPSSDLTEQPLATAGQDGRKVDDDTAGADDPGTDAEAALAQRLRKPVPVKKPFLARTVVPYSSLRIKYFWPKPIRQQLRRRKLDKERREQEDWG